MERALDEEVRVRARGIFEYCRSAQQHYPERFQIDHIIARQHGGATTPENLALCCLDCNSRKGPNIAGRDPTTGQIIPLFNPRAQSWAEHFQWSGPYVMGLTASGRATIAVLALNRPARVAVRQMLIEEGVFPNE